MGATYIAGCDVAGSYIRSDYDVVHLIMFTFGRPHAFFGILAHVSVVNTCSFLVPTLIPKPSYDLHVGKYGVIDSIFRLFLWSHLDAFCFVVMIVDPIDGTFVGSFLDETAGPVVGSLDGSFHRCCCSVGLLDEWKCDYCCLVGPMHSSKSYLYCCFLPMDMNSSKRHVVSQR